MLEISIYVRSGNVQAPGRSFKFENDELQGFLTQAFADGAVMRVSELRVLGTPNVVEGDARAASEAKPAAKTAGPGTVRAAVTPTSAPKPPVGSTPAKPATPEKK